MTVLVGGERQIGQSKSSPSSTNEASFFNNSGFVDTSVSKHTKVKDMRTVVEKIRLVTVYKKVSRGG